MSLFNHAVDPAALLEALAQQQQPLPIELQRSFQQIAHNLIQHHPNAADELRTLIEQYPPLEDAYMSALQTIDQKEAAQGRTKGLDISINGFPAGSLEGLLIEALRATDSTLEARRVKPLNISDTEKIAVLKALEKPPVGLRI